VAIYATRRDGRYVIFVLSRAIPHYPLASDDGFTPVTIDLPLHGRTSITLYRLIGDPQANNAFQAGISVDKTSLSLFLNGTLALNEESGANKRGLPPAATLVYVFETATGGAN